VGVWLWVKVCGPGLRLCSL